MSVLIVGLILLFLVSALLAWLRRRMLDRQAIRAIIWAFAYAVLILPAIFGYASLVSAGWSADYAITKARIFADGPYWSGLPVMLSIALTPAFYLYLALRAKPAWPVLLTLGTIMSCLVFIFGGLLLTAGRLAGVHF
ncbi:MAG: hypothetical protein CL558_10465 [Alphaproteobacteria bacterium]|nr:hypothetical protein [Alphaproteobacteria bacterium]MAS48438.1 hypothetical protein [Alphaproteobacteria bacterium]MAX96304.1 hypothetical protein [Alphaproteobacteria bacterium]MBN53988.1 hypothetical protein [Alphaproteobacteria bacterium]OUT39104.1 MAG: hypothetical protein CBB62_11830 [Micavibrio sp. TMED2]|tara:strand:+ start:1264 stop:1674 length:411 start_codon:yes stop_codon:yes gene_type:complete